MVRSGELKRNPFNSNVADYLLITATFHAVKARAYMIGLPLKWFTDQFIS